MSNVRVFNDNVHEHKEKFRGDWVIIPAGGFVTMNREDAVLFKSQFTPIMGKQGVRDDPRGYKMIRIDYDASLPVADVVADHKASLLCQACGFEAKTEAGLKVHVRTHVGQMVDVDAREAVQNGI